MEERRRRNITDKQIFLSLSLLEKKRIWGNGNRRRKRQLEKAKESSHLRDFIQLKEEEEARRNSSTGQTLSDVLGEPHRPPPPQPSLPVQSNRTLLDIIREEDNTANNKNKNSWKAFKEKLRLSRTITTTVHIPNPNCLSTTSQSQSNGLQSANNTPDLDLGRESLSDLLLRSNESNNGSNQQTVITLVNSSSTGENVHGVGMSLMALLEGENGEREPTAADEVRIRSERRY